MASALTIIYLFVVPWLVIQLSKRWRWIERVTPMTVLYVIGLLVGNCGILNNVAANTCNIVSNIAVPLALPLMLFGCNLKSWSTPVAVKAFLSGLIAVLIMTVGGYFIFRDLPGTISHEDYAKVAAVATGIYTGGIPNIGAISKGVDLSNNLYILVTSYDLIATGCYLLFVIFFGKPLFRKLLPVKFHNDEVIIDETQQDKPTLRSTLILVGLSLLVAAISAGITFLICGKLNIAILILILSTLALIFAQFKKINNQPGAFDIGLYIVYVFCLSIASMVNISELKLMENLSVLGYVFFVIFGSLVLQILLAKWMHLDGDTVLVSSVALINSPPFVPMVAGMLKNKDVVITGVSIGLLGYAVGNYLGIGLYQLLRLLPV